MRIYNKCSRAALCSLPDQFSRSYQCRFQVKVAVDKSRAEIFPIQIDLCLSFILSDTNYDAILDCHISLTELTGVSHEHICIFENEKRFANSTRNFRVDTISFQFHADPSFSVSSAALFDFAGNLFPFMIMQFSLELHVVKVVLTQCLIQNDCH